MKDKLQKMGNVCMA